LQRPGGHGDHDRIYLASGRLSRQHRELVPGQLPDLVLGHSLQRRGGGHQVGHELGPQALLAEAAEQVAGMFGRMGRATAADVAHALEDHAGRDARPDAVPDAQFALRHQVHDVVRQPGPGRPAVQPVDDPVVPLHQRVGALMVG
jgi:hypothetical protein